LNYNAKLIGPETLEFMRVSGLIFMPTPRGFRAINVTTVAGTAPVLPTTVSANLSDGTAKTVTVTWAAVAPASYVLREHHLQ